jgi:hypothetical protein
MCSLMSTTGFIKCCFKVIGLTFAVVYFKELTLRIVGDFYPLTYFGSERGGSYGCGCMRILLSYFFSFLSILSFYSFSACSL